MLWFQEETQTVEFLFHTRSKSSVVPPELQAKLRLHVLAGTTGVILMLEELLRTRKLVFKI